MSLAYLDAGTGSLILQAILGGIAGFGVALKVWRNKRLLRRAEKAAPLPQREEEARTHIMAVVDARVGGVATRDS